MQKSLLFIAYDSPPSAAPGAKRIKSFLEESLNLGYSPVLLTADEANYGNVDKTLHIDTSVTCHRIDVKEPVSLKAYLKRFRLLRFAWWLGYPYLWESQARWYYPVINKVLELNKIHRFEAIITTSNPYVTLRIGKKIKKKLGIPWIADLRDPFTLSPSKRWPSIFHYLLAKRWEYKSLEKADAVILATPTMASDMAKQFKTITDKMRVLRNGFFPFSKDSETSSRSTFDIVYCGTLRARDKPTPKSILSCFYRYAFDYYPSTYDFSTRSPYELFKAIKILNDSKSDLARNIRIVIAGDSDPENANLAKKLDIDSQVTFLGSVPYSESLEWMSRANLLYLPMEKRLNHGRSAFMSTKVYEYIASGKPIAVIGDPCDASDVVEQSGRGKRVDFDDINNLALFIEDIASKKFRIDANVDISRFSRKVQATVLFDTLEELLK